MVVDLHRARARAAGLGAIAILLALAVAPRADTREAHGYAPIPSSALRALSLPLRPAAIVDPGTPGIRITLPPPVPPVAPRSEPLRTRTPPKASTGSGDGTRPATQPGNGSAHGTASWYCLPGRSACPAVHPDGGLFAAAGPALRVGHWRGRWVTVTAGGRRVRVQLVDWCACPRRVIDLFYAAFDAIGDPSRGVMQVDVRW